MATVLESPSPVRPALSAGRWRTPAACVGALLALSVIVVVWARTRPGFDPYGWLVWGHQTVHGNLDTNAAPSWKPLPYIFTVPFALFGHFQMRLWMVASVAVSLSGALFGARIARRLTLAEHPEARREAWAAAVLAGGAVLAIDNYAHYVLSAQSDPMIVALCLAAIDAHLSGHERLGLLAATLAALGRPEVWPFLALYGGWLWLRRPPTRLLLVAAAIVILALWFGIPALSSRTPFVAASNALGSGRRLHSNRVFGTIGRFLALEEPGLLVAAFGAAIIALRRRVRTVLALAVGVLAWVIVEIAFALHGWPGLPRYMFEPAAVAGVLGAAGAGWLAASRRAPALAAAGIVAASLLVTLVLHARTEHRDLRVQRARTAQFNRLAADVSRLGGAERFAACGEPLTRLEDQTYLAWLLHVNVSKVGFKYGKAIRRGTPIVLFTPQRRGWRIDALHQVTPSCRVLAAQARSGRSG
jgi:hypothetical protein